ncbi:MAG: Cache 3/Cache 2 fusion domain-containing protein [Thermodesulfobacteriota bacterium]
MPTTPSTIWRPRLKAKLLGAVGALALIGLASLTVLNNWVAGRQLESMLAEEIAARAELVLGQVQNHYQTMRLHRQQDRDLIRRDLSQMARIDLDLCRLFHQRELAGELSRQQAQQRVREILLSQRVGQTGYPFVWDVSQAPRSITLAVHPVIEGQDVAWVDFVRQGAEMRRGYLESVWANPGEDQPRPKAAALEYFEPWSWVICVSAYKGEFPMLVDQRFYQAAEEALAQEIKGLVVGKHGYAFVVNWAGKLVVHPRGGEAQAETPELIQAILDQGEGLIRWRQEDEPHLVAFRTFGPTGWIVAVKARESDFLAPVKTGLAKGALLVLAMFLVLTALVLVPLLGRLVVNPARRLAAMADRIAGGVLEPEPLAVSGGDEMADLARSLHAMSERLHQSMDYLAQSERRYRELFDHSPDPGYVLSRGGYVMEINPAMERLLDRSAAEVHGMLFSAFLAPDQEDQILARIRQAVRGDQPLTQVGFTLLDRQGNPRLLEGFLTPLRKDGQLQGFYGLARDLTEQHRLQSQLMQAQKMEILGTLSGGLAHDFNNLLSGILGYSSLLLAQPDLAPRLARYVKIIDDSAGRAAQLTQQLLTLSKTHQGRREPVMLGAVVAEVLAILEHSFPPNLKLDVRLGQGLPPVEADAGQLNQALMNLCINARDAMPMGGVLTLELDLVELGPGAPPELVGLGPRALRLSVIDTGHGMDPVTRAQAVEPFFTTKEHGTGLGLAMVLSIVQGHGGVLLIESAPGQGTAVRIHLPPGRRAPAPAAEADQPGPDAGGGRVLVVDDEAVVRQLAREILLLAGYQVETAADGEEALAALAGGRPPVDLVLLDVVMPGLNGGEVLARIKAAHPWVKVVMASGMFESGQPAASAWRLADGSLQKPYRAPELLAAVRLALGRQRGEGGQ